LDLNKKDVSRLGGLDVERARQVMNLSQIHISNIIGRVVVFDFSTSPVQTLDLDDFIVGNFATRRN
jgi:hypothetical protein